MKIININQKNGEVKIKVNSTDDLIPLLRIIQEGDLVAGKTERKIKLGQENGRQKAVKRALTLEIKVAKIIFNESNLRIQGVVTKPVGDVQANSAHTIEVAFGTELKIKKQRWFKYQLDQLKQAEKNSQLPKVLLCVLDDEQANFGYLTASGIKHIGKLSLRLAKKRLEEKKKDEIKKVAKAIVEKAGELYIIVASPLFWKELVLKSLKEVNPKVAKKAALADVSTGAKKGLSELISSKTIEKLLKGVEIARHSRLVEALLAEVARNNLAAYGIKEVEKAALCGAVKDLLVSEKLMSKTETHFPTILKIIEAVESFKGGVHIISKETDAGKNLLGLGGIAAILKFKMHNK